MSSAAAQKLNIFVSNGPTSFDILVFSLADGLRVEGFWFKCLLHLCLINVKFLDNCFCLSLCAALVSSFKNLFIKIVVVVKFLDNCFCLSLYAALVSLFNNLFVKVVLVVNRGSERKIH